MGRTPGPWRSWMLCLCSTLSETLGLTLQKLRPDLQRWGSWRYVLYVHLSTVTLICLGSSEALLLWAECFGGAGVCSCYSGKCCLAHSSTSAHVIWLHGSLNKNQTNQMELGVPPPQCLLYLACWSSCSKAVCHLIAVWWRYFQQPSLISVKAFLFELIGHSTAAAQWLRPVPGVPLPGLNGQCHVNVPLLLLWSQCHGQVLVNSGIILLVNKWWCY